MKVRGDLTSGANPQTDRPNHASSNRTWSFHERYASDAEFKRQVDDAKRRQAQEQSTAALTNSLAMTSQGKKLY